MFVSVGNSGTRLADALVQKSHGLWLAFFPRIKWSTYLLATASAVVRAVLDLSCTVFIIATVGNMEQLLHGLGLSKITHVFEGKIIYFVYYYSKERV